MDSGRVRRRWLGISIGLAVGGLAPALSAQVWPTRPVRVIVPFAPGGGVDTVARLLAQRLGEQMNGSFVVDNRPGAGGVAGTTVVARAVPDGHTLLVSAPEFAINAASRRKLPFDAIRDFSFISQLTAGQFIIASHPSVPAKSVRELIALAKAQPDRLTYGSSGSGGINHLAGALFQSMAGIRWTHVPFKGAGPATVGLIGGEIDFTIASTTGLLEPIRAGRVRAIAVTGSARFAALPDVPTVAESGVPGYEVDGWYGFYGPAGLSRDLVGRLQVETRRALFHAETAERLVRTGNTPLASAPDTFASFIKAEIDKWARVIAAEGITPVD